MDKIDLQKVSDHLFYEFWMFKQLAKILKESITEETLLKPITHTTKPDTYVSTTHSTGIDKPYKIGSNEEKARVINNAILEAFAIHFRALFDFFYIDKKKGKYQDDVIVSDFFDDPKHWKDHRPNLDEQELGRLRDRVNKEIAHLTIHRNFVVTKDWKIDYILENMNLLIEKFRELVPDKYLGERWKSNLYKL
jgi:hypothetical protein